MLRLFFLLIHAYQKQNTQRYFEIDSKLLSRCALAVALQAGSMYYAKVLQYDLNYHFWYFSF